VIRLAAALLLFLPACVPAATGPVDGPAGEPQSLQEARALWASAGGDDYAYTISRSCFCPPESTGPFEVTVRDGRIARATRAGSAVDAGQLALPTVEELFDQIAEAQRTGAAEVRVSYDDRLGYPAEIWIDVDRMMADEEVGYTVSEVVVE
jgi:hypothetical protein